MGANFLNLSVSALDFELLCPSFSLSSHHSARVSLLSTHKEACPMKTFDLSLPYTHRSGALYIQKFSRFGTSPCDTSRCLIHKHIKTGITSSPYHLKMVR